MTKLKPIEKRSIKTNGTLFEQLSNYFLGPDMFEAVITINATVLMTLASLFVASMGAVPSTGSIK